MMEFISFLLVPIDVKTSHAFTLNRFFCILCRCQGNRTKVGPKELREIATKWKEKSARGFLFEGGPSLTRKLNFDPFITRQVLKGPNNKGGEKPPLLLATFIAAHRSDYFLPDWLLLLFEINMGPASSRNRWRAVTAGLATCWLRKAPTGFPPWPQVPFCCGNYREKRMFRWKRPDKNKSHRPFLVFYALTTK